MGLTQWGEVVLCLGLHLTFKHPIMDHTSMRFPKWAELQARKQIIFNVLTYLLLNQK